MAKTAQAYLDVFRSWIGYSEANGRFRTIVDLYNSHKPLARGYALQYSDEWCDGTVSAAAIKAGMVDLIGTEVGCECHINLFKQMGIWIEDGTITPKPGYPILFNWGSFGQPNNGGADHIGVVESVNNGVITTIEGNMNECVGRRTIPVGWGYIRGYAAPRFDAEGVSSIITGANTPKPVETDNGNSVLNKTSKCTGTVIPKKGIKVRTWAGTEFPQITSYPTLGYTNRVDICDVVKGPKGAKWYYILIADKAYGFVMAKNINIDGNGAEALKKSKTTVYTVQNGDTLSTIAKKYNTTVDALVKANNISNPDVINVGQKITIK